MTRGTNPASLANLEPTNRATTGAWSVERGKPLPVWLPWKGKVEQEASAYWDELLCLSSPGCHICAANISAVVRARGAMACVEEAGKEHAVPFARKSGVSKLFRDLERWEDRWLARLDRLAEHLKDHERQQKANTPTAADYLKAVGS